MMAGLCQLREFLQESFRCFVSENDIGMFKASRSSVGNFQFPLCISWK